MRIQSMFKDDINRKINGVVKVDQDESSVLVQELNEYVITRELKRHFITFFHNYIESFNETTADIGVWISGFFGSGKSHFLKMLSYLLENKEVQGVRTVERFRAKFASDPATFMLIDHATKGRTDTILFYLGSYGENLKVAKLEQFIAKKGKTEEFRRVFEEKNGASWLESRDAYAFFEDDIVAALREVLGMSEQAASNWFNGTETVEIDGDLYEITKVHPEAGEIVLYLGMLTLWRRPAASVEARFGWSAPGKRPSTRSSRPVRMSFPAFRPALRLACPCPPPLQMR